MHSNLDRVLSNHRWLALCLLAAAALPTAGGCHRAPTDPLPAASLETNSAATAAIVYPQRTTIHRQVSQPGYIQAFEETPMFAKVAGYVQKWNVDRGDTVKKDQVLAELWVPELEVTVKEKEALVRQMEAEIKQAKEALAAADAAFHSAEAKVTEFEAKYQGVEARYGRMKSQSERFTGMKTVIDKENIEEAQLGFRTATANLAEANAAVKSARALQVEAKAKWSKAEADVAVVEMRLSVARKQRDYARTMWDYARLPAPYDGVVTDRTINSGDFVQPAGGDKGRPLYVVMRTDIMRIFVQVPETDAEWVHPGAAARVRVQSLPGREFPGKVTRIAWALDPATRTLLAEIDLPNRDGSLRPGYYVYATLSADVPDLLTLPRSAVITEGDVTSGYRTFCYELRDGKSQRLPLKIGVGDRRRVQVLKKQLPPDRPDEPPQWVDFTAKETILRDAANAARSAS